MGTDAQSTGPGARRVASPLGRRGGAGRGVARGRHAGVRGAGRRCQVLRHDHPARRRKLAVGFMPTTDRRSFEPPGARDWQGAHVLASRSLPCVGGDEWQFGGLSGTRVTSSVRGWRTASQGQKTLRLQGRFVGGTRAIVRLELRSARAVAGCSVPGSSRMSSIDSRVPAGRGARRRSPAAPRVASSCTRRR